MNRLIVFEGIDGVGKTTMSKSLTEWLRANGIPAVRYEDVEDARAGFNLIKPFIRENVQIEGSLLFYLSSAIYKSSRIDELLKEKWVICDRYVFSTIGDHLSRGSIVASSSLIEKLPIRMPDYTFLLVADEVDRALRNRERPDQKKDDLLTKDDAPRLSLMEEELMRHADSIIDTSDGASETFSIIIQKIKQFL